MIYIDRFLSKIIPQIIPDKTLIVLDEADAGFSLQKQSKYINLIEHLCFVKKASVLLTVTYIIKKHSFRVLFLFVYYQKHATS